MSINATTWRTHPQAHTGYLYIYRPAIVFSASINQTTFSYPLTQLTFDNVTVGSSATPQINQLIRIKDASGTIKGHARVRSAFDSTLAYLGRISQNEITFADNDILEVLDDRRLMTYIPYIDPNGNVYYDEQLYSAENDQFIPVANAGSFVIDLVDASDEITVSLDGTNSFATAAGASLSSYLWNVDDGTITVGSASDSTITATFPKGTRWVSLTVTDSNGQSHTTYVFVAAVSPDQCEKVSRIQLEGSLESGWELGFNLLPDSQTDPPDNNLVLLFSDDYYNWSKTNVGQSQTGREHIKFIGWCTAAQNITINPDLALMDFQAVSAMGIMRTLPAYSKTVERNASPTDWNHLPDLTLWRFYLYLLRYNGTALELLDIDEPAWANDYDLLILDADTSTQAEQLQAVGSAIFGYCTNDHLNRLRLVKDNHLLTSGAARDAIATAVTMTEADFIDRVQVSIPVIDQIMSLKAYAILASTTEVDAVASISGNSPAQFATQTQTINNRAVVSQTALNLITGHKFAQLNARNINQARHTMTLSGTIPHGFLALDPAEHEWIAFTGFSGTHYACSDTRFTLQRVTINFDVSNGIVTENYQLLEETEGVSGNTVPIPTNEDEGGGGGFYDNWPPSEIDLLPPFLPPLLDPDYTDTEGIEAESGRVIAWSEDYGMITYNRGETNPDWEPFVEATGTDILRYFALDGNSSFVRFGTGALGVYMALSNPDSDAGTGIYYNADLTGSGSWEKVTTDINNLYVIRNVQFNRDYVVGWALGGTSGGETVPDGSWVQENYFGNGGGNPPPAADIAISELNLSNYVNDIATSNRDAHGGGGVLYTSLEPNSLYAYHRIRLVATGLPDPSSAVGWFKLKSEWDEPITIDRIRCSVYKTGTNTYAIYVAYKEGGAFGSYDLKKSFETSGYKVNEFQVGSDKTITGIEWYFFVSNTFNNNNFNINALDMRLAADYVPAGADNACRVVIYTGTETKTVSLADQTSNQGNCAVNYFSSNPCVIANADNALYFIEDITASTPSATLITLLTALEVDEDIIDISIPYYRFGYDDKNDDPETTDFFLGTNQNLYLCTIDLTTNTMLFQVDSELSDGVYDRDCVVMNPSTKQVYVITASSELKTCNNIDAGSGYTWTTVDASTAASFLYWSQKFTAWVSGASVLERYDNDSASSKKGDIMDVLSDDIIGAISL